MDNASLDMAWHEIKMNVGRWRCTDNGVVGLSAQNLIYRYGLTLAV